MFFKLNMNGSCSLCDKPDDDWMVACDHCKQWFHYVCVGVDDTIKDIPWECAVCARPPRTSVGTGTTATSTTEMQRDIGALNATLEFPVTPISTAAIVTSAHQPFSGIFPVNNVLSTVSTAHIATCLSSSAFTPIHTNTVTNTVATSMYQPLYTGGMKSTPLTTPLSHANVIAKNFGREAREGRALFQEQEERQMQSRQQELMQKQQTELMQKQQTKLMQKQQTEIMQRRQQLELELLQEEKELQSQYLRRKYENLAIIDASNTAENTKYIGPTKAQIAARQVLPKNLPDFAGEPDDWPLFLSAFENTTLMGGFTNAENLMRLQACLKGKAKEIVKSKLLMPAMVPDIIATLRMCFGRPEIIIERMIEKARQLKAPGDRLEALIDFSLAVKNITNTIEASDLKDYLNNPMLVKEFVDKLPNQHKLTWAMQPKSEEPAIVAFSNWLFGLAEAASKVVCLTPPKPKTKGAVNIHTVETPTNETTPQGITTQSCIFCKQNHKLSKCTEFEQMTIDRKWDIVKENKLCRQCLRSHRRKCFIDRECGVNGCKYMHHPLLHSNAYQQAQANQGANTTAQANQQTHISANVNTHNASDKTLSRILPIKIRAKNKLIDTFAFLDEGSTITIIDEDLLRQTGVNGFNKPLHLRWTGDTTRYEESSVCATIEIANANNGTVYKLKGVQSVKNLELQRQTLDMRAMALAYPYLKGLPVKSYTAAQPMIIIGLDNWNLAVPLKIKEGSFHQPIATKTRLGWAIQGCRNKHANQHRLNIHMCDCQQQYDELHKLVQEQFNLEAIPKTIMSKDDSQALDILRATCKKQSGRFVVGLPWRDPSAKLPDSYATAHSRLLCLQRKFKKDVSLHTKMQNEIDNLLQKNYARKLTPEEISSVDKHVWYLPIFVTTNPNKPNRVRLVWDAAAKTNGQSLNDFLLSGPDLLTPLVNILLTFRVGKIAICGDIAEMFHQIRVRPEDMHAQRFLWCSLNGDTRNPDVYVMEALSFGTSCAPFIVHYVRNANADNFEQQYPRAVAAIKQAHYVDDLIDSADSIEETMQLAKDVRSIHAAAGFNIRNWVSNSADIANELNNRDVKEQSPHELSSTEKVLGMYWDPNADCFKYVFKFARLKRDVLASDVAPTKREMLQVLMSIYDPLGFISCYTVELKILMQNVWRADLGWDDNLEGELLEMWQEWKTTLVDIAKVSIPRCFSTSLKTASNVQLHTFVDAGEDAYCAVCYLRIDTGQSIEISLVATKAKVTPLKPITVPRLELQAATVGIRLAQLICSIHRIPINECVWWTDSKTVLKWLRMNPKLFNQFVMFRVAEILEFSNPSQWRWVPSKINPADLATKLPTNNDVEKWFKGPEFLKLNSEDWPKCSDCGTIDSTEMRRLNLHSEAPAWAHPQFNTEHFSDWRRLYRSVAMWVHYFDIIRYRSEGINARSTFECTQRAKNLLYRQAQLTVYAAEISNLQRNQPIQISSNLVSLNPYLDNYGLLRMEGRTNLIEGIEDAIILPKNCHTTFLVVRFYHEKFHHQLHEAIINEIRTQFYIPQLRVIYKKVQRSCNQCKLLNAKPSEPQMAALPRARLAAFQRPFTHVGIDFFGPINVSVGRRREKRWGVIFTCLTMRAIHIELAHSLDTTSCVMCIQNFISRRGVPREIYTDNGTNFKATERLLREHYQTLDFSTVADKFDEIRWSFNPPAAPHMGGAWERLIRSIKSVLKVICPSSNFTDESLHHAMCEVEFIINSRPLTFVALDVPNEEALTPNHFLLGSAGGQKPFCAETPELKESWKRASAFANIFWQKWLKEYTPTIARRGKWFQKRPPLKSGDVVVIVDENLPRNCWPKGIIEAVTTSKDGQVRRAMERTTRGTLERPATKLAPLDIRVNSE